MRNDRPWSGPLETYLKLFEVVIEQQVKLLGRESAYTYARKAGLVLSETGKVVSAADNPHIILLRLVKAFTATGNIECLAACIPLVNEFLARAAGEEKLAAK